MLCHPWPTLAVPKLGPGSVWVPPSHPWSSVYPLLPENLVSDGLWWCCIITRGKRVNPGLSRVLGPILLSLLGRGTRSHRPEQLRPRACRATSGFGMLGLRRWRGTCLSAHRGLARVLIAPARGQGSWQLLWRFSVALENFSVRLGTLGCAGAFVLGRTTGIK